MSRLLGERSLTTRSPMEMVPPVIGSSPPTIRSAVVLPQPDGPTSTMNSPSSMARSSSSTARVSPPTRFEFTHRPRVTGEHLRDPVEHHVSHRSLLHGSADQPAHQRPL